MSVQMTVSWDVTSCSLVDRKQSVGETRWFRVQGIHISCGSWTRTYHHLVQKWTPTYHSLDFTCNLGVGEDAASARRT